MVAPLTAKPLCFWEVKKKGEALLQEPSFLKKQKRLLEHPITLQASLPTSSIKILQQVGKTQASEGKS